jgi:lipopolysaccharide export system protein LptA
MSLGFDAISALPISASGNEGNVIISVTGNALTLSVGASTATGQAANVIVASDPLTIGSGAVTLTADANVNITASPLTLNSALVTASGAGNISISGMPLTLKASSVTITGGANIDVTDNQLTISSNESGVITWNPIIPGANNVWKEIEPY